MRAAVWVPGVIGKVSQIAETGFRSHEIIGLRHRSPPPGRRVLVPCLRIASGTKSYR
jgi:hypothetical protein